MNTQEAVTASAPGSEIALKYKNYILNDRKPFRVRTGNGFVACQGYLPVHIENRNKIIKAK